MPIFFQQRIKTIFDEINEAPSTKIQFSKLIAHPVLCEMISICNKFRSPVKNILSFH
jgi:hypothetical protein